MPNIEFGWEPRARGPDPQNLLLKIHVEKNVIDKNSTLGYTSWESDFISPTVEFIFDNVFFF